MLFFLQFVSVFIFIIIFIILSLLVWYSFMSMYFFVNN